MMRLANAAAAIALLGVLFDITGLGSEAFAGSCIQGNKHGSVTYLLIDRTDEIKDISALKQLFGTLRDTFAKRDGERLVVGVISGKTAESRIVMDRATPGKDMWESAIKLRKQRNEFLACLDEVEKGLLQQNEKAPASAILETIIFVADFLRRDPSPTKRLIIFSDMVQNSDAVSFYGKRSNEPLEIIMARLVSEKRIPKLNGVVIDVAGAGTGVSEQVGFKVKEFWQRVFEQGGAKLRSYGPVLTDL